MRTNLLTCLYIVVCVALAAFVVAGCGGSLIIPTYVGGGIPPGDLDIGGAVVQDVPPPGEASAVLVPVAGAEVVLYRGANEVGRTATGVTGHFSFESPDTGNYRVRVTGPDGSGLQPAERQFQHRHGQQTFLTITLEPE